MEKRKKRNVIIISIIITICILVIIYFGMVIYFMNHFYFGSEINCINVSGKTVEEVEEQMPDEIKSYVLELEELDGNKEQIRGSDINLKFNPDWESQKAKDKQNPFEWISSLFGTKDSKMTERISYDAELLKEQLSKLSCFDSNNIIEPKNAGFKYRDDGYVILDEINGNKVNKDILYDEVANTIASGETILDLELMDCYEKPQYTPTSQEVIDTKNILDKYISSEITYTFGEKKEVLNGSTINNWLKVNENLEIIFDEEKVKTYLDVLSKTYNSVGKTREFVTSIGSTIKVSGGDYGWIIDNEKEEESLIAEIKEGQATTREPAYKQIAISHDDNDIGNTYVEINMTKQHLWFYKNGSLIVEGDVVTGNVSNNTSTPVGVYRVKYKQRDTNLKGEGYCVPVSFWMPFNGGIGIHDAVWRSVFGGDIYRSSGSHGCINAPYNLANTIFNNIEEGNPIICY